ncbi:MAG: ROK family protein [Chloroflexota bacterium]
MNEIRASRHLGKQINRKLVLNLIKAGPTSRAEIATGSGLSAATVSNLTVELLDEGLIHETGVVETSRGRPPVLLRLNSKARYVVGVKVMPNALVAVVTDLDANVVGQRTLAGWGSAAATNDSLHATSAAVVERLAQLVEEVIEEAGIERSDLLGVGVGLAGIIDGVAGICRYSPFFGWRDVDLVSPLEAQLGLDVRLANDVDSLTIAEQWFGHGQAYEHFVVVTVGRGIGAGFVLNGRFYGGHEGGVGELAHVTLVPDGPTCACGKRGCLETLASDVALIAAAQAAIADGQATDLAGVDRITIGALVAAAESGDEVARGLLADSGRWLGVGMAMLVNLLNPQLIILAGEGVEAGEWRLAPMRRALREAQFDSLGANTRLVVEFSGDITWARGAACVVLSDFFKSPLYQDRPVALSGGTVG